MKPMFSYYGSKYIGAKHYGPPRREIVIEPFAGSACYSLYHNVEKAMLFDKSETVCALWDYLIHVSPLEILAMPSRFEHDSDLDKLGTEQRILVGFWVGKGRAEPSKTLSSWYFNWRNDQSCSVWSDAVKFRIASQVSKIRRWEIDQCSYENVPLIDAHYHIDPPYSGAPGRRYPHSDLDYRKLAKWVIDLPGTVDVCENSGAEWLPFEELYEVNSMRGRRGGSISKEVVFTK